MVVCIHTTLWISCLRNLVFKPHQLKGDHKGQWECHIEPNWLMTWEQNDNELTLLFLQTGTHSDIFGW